MIRVSIVNRFYPPDPAITGVSAQELANYLTQHVPEASVRIVASAASYAGGRKVGTAAEDVERIRSWYHGTRALPRLVASLVEGARLASRATREADVVISLTDPPLLGLWIGLARRRRRFQWAEWTMDLYPEAFAAAGMASPRNPIYRLLSSSVRRRLPDRYIALGPQQLDFLSAARGDVPGFVLPCGVTGTPAGPAPAWRQQHPGHVVVAYAGNLGQAHSERVLLDFVRRAPAEQFRFVLSLYGASAGHAREALGEDPRVVWCQSISHLDLAHADVHLASLKCEWTHVCVPSKAISSVCLGRPIIFAGSASSDSWGLLEDAGWLIPLRGDGTHSVEDVDRVLSELVSPSIRTAKQARASEASSRLLKLKQRAMQDIAAWVRAAPLPARSG